ncbi:Inclusion body protein [Tenacibaculum sp. MAR_2009_124]|uniref:AidA/PixA family protein n=1 Tax=Tenacibaculum sp. MAR_2009_124 TaxID=1250059 RepID=UPI000898842B|nr:AidA/PixA family protein [Tenacibaculum sp. MAR_2009_124]SEB36533.1 Inclusion body protein [Tenacibaculum sp. MAR_2009_124]
MSKAIWTINTIVNTQFLHDLSGSGTWENPVGGGQYFNDHIYFVATRNTDGKVVTGNDTNFSLEVKPHDNIQWVVNPSNLLNDNQYGVVMYGFETGSNWDNALTSPDSRNVEAYFAQLTNGFNSPNQPSGNFLKGSSSEISIPETNVKAEPKFNETISYHIKLILLDLSKPSQPKALKFVKADPRFVIQKDLVYYENLQTV